jgi:hypothetical protein
MQYTSFFCRKSLNIHSFLEILQHFLVACNSYTEKTEESLQKIGTTTKWRGQVCKTPSCLNSAAWFNNLGQNNNEEQQRLVEKLLTIVMLLFASKVLRRRWGGAGRGGGRWWWLDETVRVVIGRRIVWFCVGFLWSGKILEDFSHFLVKY